MEHFGVATLCHISRSQEQRNMACDVLVVGGTRGVGGEATLEQCWLRLSWSLLLGDEQLWHDFLL